MFRAKPPRADEPRRLRWRRAKSGADAAPPAPAPPQQPDHDAQEQHDQQQLEPNPDSVRSDSTDDSAKTRPLRRLAAIFRETDARTEENLKSLKRRVVQVRRQPDAAPVRFQMGFRSRTGWEPIRATKENQDCLVALVPWGPASSFNFFAALDGHGRHGHTCAIFVAQRVVAFLARVLRADGDRQHVVDTLHRAIVYAERKLEAPGVTTDFRLSGSTGVFALVHNSTLFCANVGDSRAVVGREEEKTRARRSHDRKDARKNKPRPLVKYFPVKISVDQKPSRPDEKARLLAAGARVDAWEGVDVGEERVWLPEARTPGLAVSRSFGDLLVKEYGVSCIPEVYTLDLCEDDRFLVMASDGVFEFMTNEEVVKLVGKWRDRGSAQDAAEELVRIATERWIDDDSVIDDISCVVVFMNVVSPEASAPREPHLAETSVGVASDSASDVDPSPSSRDLTSNRGLPDGLELVTTTSSTAPLGDREADFSRVDARGELDESFFGNTEDSHSL